MKFQWSEYCRPVYNPDGPSGIISNRMKNQMEKPDGKEVLDWILIDGIWYNLGGVPLTVCLSQESILKINR